MRLLFAALLVLGPLNAFQRFVVEPMVPLFRAVIEDLDGQFVITDARLTRAGPNDVVLFRANLRGPVTVVGGVVYPFGSHGIPAGGYQVTYTLSGVLLYGALLLIIALAWPARGVRELAVRMLISIFFVGVLLLIDAPTTVVAELRHLVETSFDRTAVGSWMIWSRFLMGGGGIALSILLAVVAIHVGRRCSRFPAAHNHLLA